MQRDDQIGCFDPARAEFAICVLAVDRVVDLLTVSHAPERIDAYRDAMRRGDRFPPIAVVRVGRRFLIADGHKRFSAYQALGGDHIVVEVWPLRRWLRDQWGQLTRKTRQQASVVWRSRTDPRARREAIRLAHDTIGHWRRVGRSLRERFWRPGPDVAR